MEAVCSGGFGVVGAVAVHCAGMPSIMDKRRKENIEVWLAEVERKRMALVNDRY